MRALAKGRYLLAISNTDQNLTTLDLNTFHISTLLPRNLIPGTQNLPCAQDMFLHHPFARPSMQNGVAPKAVLLETLSGPTDKSDRKRKSV